MMYDSHNSTGRPEHGGNCDIKNLSRGSKVYLPVHVPGAKFSVGDCMYRDSVLKVLSINAQQCIFLRVMARSHSAEPLRCLV